MSDSHARLIGALAADLRPVRRVAPPWVRAIAWSLAVAVLAGLVAAAVGQERVQQRVPPVPGLIWALAWPALTAFTAAWAAFQTGVPGSSRRWVWLPVPPLALWLAASGIGCVLHEWAPAAGAGEDPGPMECLRFILASSVPLSGLMFLMLRRTLPLVPGVTAALAGLAAAAGAATLLALFHPVGIALLDLGVHAGAVLLVVAASRLAGARYLLSGPG